MISFPVTAQTLYHHTSLLQVQNNASIIKHRQIFLHQDWNSLTFRNMRFICRHVGISIFFVRWSLLDFWARNISGERTLFVATVKFLVPAQCREMIKTANMFFLYFFRKIQCAWVNDTNWLHLILGLLRQNYNDWCSCKHSRTTYVLKLWNSADFSTLIPCIDIDTMCGYSKNSMFLRT